MSRIEVTMPSGSGVQAGQTATFKLPIGRRYHSLQLACSATTFAVSDLTEIRVFVNEQVVQRFSGAQRDAMNKFDGRHPATIDATSFLLVIPFDRYRLNTLRAEEETAINTGSQEAKTAKAITSFRMEVDITGAGSLTGTPTMTLNATQSEAQPGGPGTLMYVQRHTRNIAGAGDFDISDLPRGSASSIALNRLFLNPDANNITALKVERNQYIIWQRVNALNNRLQADGYRVPQPGWFVLDKTEQALGGDPIDLVGAADYRYTLTTDGAMNVTALSEYLGALAT